MSKKDIIRIALLIPALLLCGGGCQKRTPEQEAEKAFKKAFEHEYPDWEVTKIILSPCQGANMYRGRFDCETRTATKKCWFEKEECEVVEISAPCNPDTPKIGLAKYFDDKPLMSSRWKLVPCSETHYKGETKTWSVLVTYAHGDCYYKLGKDAEEYR